MLSLTDLNVPASSSTVQVSAINTLSMSNITASTLISPDMPGFSTLNVVPSWSFLVEHTGTSGEADRLLFDLGMRKDYAENAPSYVKHIIGLLGWNFHFKGEKDVYDVLSEGKVDLKSIKAIIWGHIHFDHTGDPNRFPSSTKLIVGPGFKESFTPGFPEGSDSPVSTDAWEGRELYEIDFVKDSNGLVIGGYDAVDYFEDGSFYILNVPGHCIGHICALARDTPDTFIFLGGDTSHYPGIFRPSSHAPLPKEIVPNPLNDSQEACPCSVFTALHPQKESDVPFFTVPPTPGGANYDIEETLRSRDKLQLFDASEDVFVVISHDRSLQGLIPEYPNTLNNWKDKKLKERGKWRWLSDFKELVRKDL